MRILMVSQFWTPEPFLKALPFARELVRRGHKVEVLTGFPNYPGGKIYPGYRRQLFKREWIEGVRVNRVWLYPSHDGSGRRRILNYLSFAASALLLGPFVTQRADVIYVYHPPASVALPAKLLSKLKRAPIVYDIQDLWPDSVVGTQMLPRRLVALLNKYCNWVNRKMNRLVVLSPGFSQELTRRGVPKSKIDVILNWCDEDSLRPVPYDEETAQSLGFDSALNILFAGTMGVYQALDTILDAARLLHSRGADVKFLFIGGGIERTRIQKMAEDLPNVCFLDQRPMGEMPTIISCADVLLVHLKNEPLFHITIPSKTQAYLFAGKPILMGVKGDAADLVRKAGAGTFFNPQDTSSLVDAVLAMAHSTVAERELMGRRGATFYNEHLSLRNGVDRFEALFEIAVKERKVRLENRSIT